MEEKGRSFAAAGGAEQILSFPGRVGKAAHRTVVRGKVGYLPGAIRTYNPFPFLQRTSADVAAGRKEKGFEGEKEGS